MEHIMIGAMQACETYAEKSVSGATLTEYESQAYEWLCRLVASHSQYLSLRYRESIPEAERDALQAEREHAEWLRAQDQDQEECQ